MEEQATQTLYYLAFRDNVPYSFTHIIKGARKFADFIFAGNWKAGAQIAMLNVVHGDCNHVQFIFISAMQQCCQNNREKYPNKKHRQY